MQTTRIAKQPEREDLQSQLEDLLGAVWKAEANWRVDDRIDLATRNMKLVVEHPVRKHLKPAA